MAIYKFKVTYEDHEDVYRELEILSDQTFQDLHLAIQKAIEFDNSQSASFYMSNDSWKKGQEITLKESDLDGEGPNKKPKKLMSKSKLVGFIDDPHQKIIYVFDFKTYWTFCIELVKIILDTPKGEFPRCVKTNGNAPKQYKKINLPPPDEDLEEEDDAKNDKEKIFSAEEDYDKSDGDEDDDSLIEEEKGEESEESEEGEESDENVLE